MQLIKSFTADSVLHSLHLLSLTRYVSAGQFLDKAAVPAGVSNACATALTAEVACRDSVADLTPGRYYPLSTLQVICNQPCSSALSTYHASVLANCARDVWEDDTGTQLPVPIFSELIRYAYNLTCLSEGNRFCNNVAAAFAAATDPEASAVPGGIPAGGDFGQHDTSNPCDACLLANLRFQAGSPLYNGPVLRSRSIYQSKTSSCGVSNLPLTTVTNSILTTTSSSPTSTPSCEAKRYSIQPGDDCHSISLSQGIATEWLIIDNDLAAFCHDFPTEGDLCLVNTCKVYTVLESDTCRGISRAHNLTESELQAWNPSINAGCYNLGQMIGDQICVSKPGTPYISPSVPVIVPTIPTTAAPVPTNAAVGSNRYCGTWHEARVGEFCNLLVMKYSISQVDFVFLNTAINENCTNLFAEEAYCVRAVGDINTYSGRPGYGAPTLTMSGFINDTATTLPDASFTYPSPIRTPLPLASGTRHNCEQYSSGDDWQQNLTSTYFTSHCAFMAAVVGVTLEDLQVWNPSLGNTSDSTCSFATGVRYCSKYFSGNRPVDAGDRPSRFPARDGMTANCTITVDVRPNGMPTCLSILAEWDLTISEFFAMNPSVGADCSGMWPAICLNSHEESLRQFDEVFNDTALDLRGLVKSIHYDVILPRVSEKRLENKFQSSFEARQNSAAFTKAIFGIFSRLSTWKATGIALRLTATSPSDDITLRECTKSISIIPHRNEFRYIRFDSIDLPSRNFPAVHCVTSLDTETFDRNSTNPSGRRLHPHLLLALAEGLPGLREISWALFMPPRRLATQRQQFRAALADALTIPAFSHLRTMRAWLHDSDQLEEEVGLENVTAHGIDALSLAVRRVFNLPSLTTVHLRGKWILSTEAFSGHLSESVTAIFIDISSITPDGKWLFDFDEPDPEELEFRRDEYGSDKAYSSESGLELERPQRQKLPEDFDSEDSDTVDEFNEEAVAKANFETFTAWDRWNPSSETFTPLAQSLINAVARQSPHLSHLEVHIKGPNTQIHLGYLSLPKGERPEFWKSWKAASDRIGQGYEKRPDNGLITVWHIHGHGTRWKLPTILRNAMEECVGEDEIFATEDGQDMEME
ncbi:LysM domain-containing protein [Paramyrothecium foliicola]|nr:LysM domain-containing protein [Paramyrothecium foliicola]